MKSDRRGGACPDRVVINPDGKVIRIPEWAHRRLRRMGLCAWDRRDKRYRIDPKIRGFMDLIKTPDFKPKGVRALKLEGKDGGRPKKCGYSSELLRVLGPELDGLSHPSSSEIKELLRGTREEPCDDTTGGVN